MLETIILTGMILEVGPVNDYDRRLVILTKERGRITAFCRGARRQNNRLMAATNPFAFGKFKLYEGKSAYNVTDAEISYYFEELREDFEGAYLGMYFLEFASYYTRENNDEREMLKLLFQSVRAIIKPNLDNKLIRSVFEIKVLAINGEFPGLPRGRTYSEGLKKTVDFIVSTPTERLYTFVLSDSVLNELNDLSKFYMERYVERRFKSLEMLDNSLLKL